MNTQAIIEIMKAQIAKPARAGCNSESGFVVDKLRNAGFYEEADIYWSYACSAGTKPIDPEIAELHAKLREIDKAVKLPAWSTHGT